ncbi:MAG: DNA polymerase III subunit gamma/tau [Acidobacteria bacterium]|nr:DNA polymerase III subunit gamma/tau [Acidobacteriota bacterium]
MGYLVIARKWRPKQFEDVVGQQGLTRTLQNAIRQGRISHAYLFTGTRGVGKTSTARILAKGLNCMHEAAPTAHPCDACVSCQEITQGNSVDVLEIDAASNRGIGEIRELRENVRYTPSRDRYKIFIIDEVHMLTSEAFNALLKTLEEPPGHVIFILATTELYKIPQTIVSRCQQFDFRIIPFVDIHERLRKVVAAEGVDVSDQALQYVVKASGGSMRDAESALQKIISYGGGDISDEDIAALLGVVKQESLNTLMRAVVEADFPEIIRVVNDLYDKGHDLQSFIRACIEYVRNMAVYRISEDEDQFLLLSDEDREQLRDLAGRVTVEELLRMYDFLVRAENELKWAPFVRFHTEMALLKLASLGRLAPLEDVLAMLAAGAEAAPRPAPEAGRAAPATDSAPKPRPAAPPGPPAERDRVEWFLQEAANRFPQLRPILRKAEWRLAETTLEIVNTGGPAQEGLFRLESTQSALKEVFRGLFGTTPDVVLRNRETAAPKPAPAPPPAPPRPPEESAPAQRTIEKQFQDDPIGRLIIDRIPGRWQFQPKE